MSRCWPLWSLGVLLALARMAAADVFELHSGGAVHGQLVNANQSPRTRYVIKTHLGGEVTLTADQVKKVRPQTAIEVRYDQIRPRATDTVADQWKLAEWCRENRLMAQRRTHLERIIELEPNHAQARRGLGYSQVQGRWVTHDLMMKENGYVRHNGAWLLPQEIELKEQQHKDKQARLEWAGKVKRWQRWLGSDKAADAVAEIKAVEDPYAADALARALNDFKNPAPRDVRLLYVDALSRLDQHAGMNALVRASLDDVDEEVRLTSLERIVDEQYKPAVKTYINTLRDKDNEMINRAAVCLGKMNDPTAVGPLIDALVTKHKFVVQKGQPGQTQATFGTGPGNTGGGGFTFGGSSTEIIWRTFENQEVLRALVALTGASFNFDQRGWKTWYAAQRRPTTVDARRDGVSATP